MFRVVMALFDIACWTIFIMILATYTKRVIIKYRREIEESNERRSALQERLDRLDDSPTRRLETDRVLRDQWQLEN